MDLLPIKSIREEDFSLVGRPLVSLAKLAHLDFPVPGGVVVFAPNIKLRTIIEHFNFSDREVFEQSLHIVKNEVNLIEAPKELEKLLTEKKLDAKKIWLSLLDGWVEEVRSKIWREGFNKDITKSLSAQPIFFIGNLECSGEASYNYNTKLAEIKISKGNLDHEEILALEEMVLDANKKLYTHNTYHFIKDETGKIYIVRIAPFTPVDDPAKAKHVPNPTPEDEIVRQKIDMYRQEMEKHNGSEAGWHKSTIKVFLNIADSLKIERNVDGVIICGEKQNDFDTKVMQVVEAALSCDPSPLIFKLPDIQDNKGGVRGTLRLIHSSDLLKKETEAILFARNKKHLLNVSVAIPFVRSVDEFLQIKRDLAALGVMRKGSLKLWLEAAVVENLINLDEYILAGLDGVILNLDELASWIGGYDHATEAGIFYRKQVRALIILVDQAIKKLHNAGVKVLVSGSLALHDDVLDYLVETYVYGICVDFAHAPDIKSHLNFLENRLVRSKIA